MVSHCNENAHELWMALVEKYEVSEEKHLNGVTNRWNTCIIKDTSQYLDILFNEIYDLNLKFNKIKEKYDKY